MTKAPVPPYYAVIFTSRRTPGENGYPEAAEEMLLLAAEQPGYLGVESARDAEGLGITVSYWSSPEHISLWKQQADHMVAQRRGRERWYEAYTVRICKV